MKRTFKLEEVLSAIRGTLLCEIGKVYEVLNFLTGVSIYTHQIPRAGRECQVAVFEQVPFLQEINIEGINPDNWKERLTEIKAKYPNEIELSPVSTYSPIDPIEEMIQMRDKVKS
jgi:hypothetical protein